MAQIFPRLWVGGFDDATHKGFLERKQITNIINCSNEVPMNEYPCPIEAFRVPMEDDEYPGAEQHLRVGAAALQKWLTEGRTVLVHCRAGISRSPTVVMAWLILYNKMSFDDAYAVVAKARKETCPNGYFREILKKLRPV